MARSIVGVDDITTRVPPSSSTKTMRYRRMRSPTHCSCANTQSVLGSALSSAWWTTLLLVRRVAPSSSIKDEDNQSTTTNDDAIPEEEESCFAGVVLRTRRVISVYHICSIGKRGEGDRKERDLLCFVLKVAILLLKTNLNT